MNTWVIFKSLDAEFNQSSSQKWAKNEIFQKSNFGGFDLFNMKNLI